MLGFLKILFSNCKQTHRIASKKPLSQFHSSSITLLDFSSTRILSLKEQSSLFAENDDYTDDFQVIIVFVVNFLPLFGCLIKRVHIYICVCQ